MVIRIETRVSILASSVSIFVSIFLPQPLAVLFGSEGADAVEAE